MGLMFGGKRVAPVVTKEVAKTKFGATVDTWIGDVDENGVLQKTTWEGALDFSGVKHLGSATVFPYKFYQTDVTSVNLGDLESLDSLYCFEYAFSGCKKLESINFDSLIETKSSGAMRYAFSNCDKLKKAMFPSLKKIGGYGLQNTFRDCSFLEETDFSALETIETGGFNATFYNCTALKKMSFPSLTSINANAFGTGTASYPFRGCTGMVEIHFRADMQATVEALAGYANKFGATSSTIYFDL